MNDAPAPPRAPRGALIASIVLALVVGLVGGYVLGHRSAAGGSEDLAAAAARASASAHNSSDIAFVQGMLPHHRQAVVMAGLAASRAQSPRVKALAAAIEAAQRPEIDTMTGWLRAWGAPISGSSQKGMSMGTGMMSGPDLRSLSKANGRAFDHAFLTMMVGHHEGAVEMAGTELAHGTNADALALAASIRLTQQAQIDQMQNFLGR